MGDAQGEFPGLRAADKGDMIGLLLVGAFFEKASPLQILTVAGGHARVIRVFTGQGVVAH